jgi:hypothetical protein
MVTGAGPPPVRAPAGLLRRGWTGIAQVVAIAAIAGRAVAAIYAEQATMHRGLGVLAHTRVGWVLAGVGAEFVSMAAFGQLERLLLRAAGRAGAPRSTARWDQYPALLGGGGVHPRQVFSAVIAAVWAAVTAQRHRSAAAGRLAGEQLACRLSPRSAPRGPQARGGAGRRRLFVFFSLLLVVRPPGSLPASRPPRCLWRVTGMTTAGLGWAWPPKRESADRGGFR